MNRVEKRRHGLSTHEALKTLKHRLIAPAAELNVRGDEALVARLDRLEECDPRVLRQSLSPMLEARSAARAARRSPQKRAISPSQAFEIARNLAAGSLGAEPESRLRQERGLKGYSDRLKPPAGIARATAEAYAASCRHPNGSTAQGRPSARQRALSHSM